jgi:hypothetical protein
VSLSRSFGVWSRPFPLSGIGLLIYEGYIFR